MSENKTHDVYKLVDSAAEKFEGQSATYQESDVLDMLPNVPLPP